MSHTTPDSHNVALDFDSEVHTPTNPHNVVLDFGASASTTQSIRVGGIDSSTYGQVIAKGSRALFPTGFIATSFGEQELITDVLIEPTGFDESFVYNPNVWNFNREIEVFGFDESSVETPSKVYILRQYIQDVGGDDAASIAVGNLWISNGVHYVGPHGVEPSDRFGQAGLPFKQTVVPEGVDATSFGIANVSPRYAYPIGWGSLVLGDEHLVSYGERRIFPESVELSYGLGDVTVHSTVFSQWVVDVSFYASLYGRAVAVNKNRTVYPDGLGPPRFPTHALEEVNTPSYIYTRGISSHLVPVAKTYQAYQFIGSKYLGDSSPSTGLINLNEYGLAHVEFGIRFILAPSIRSTLLVSTELSIRDRVFYPQAIHANAGELFGNTDFSHEIRYIRTGGVDSAAYGDIRFILEKYLVYVPFIFAFAAGGHVVGDGVRSIRAGGLAASESVGARMRVEFFRRAHRLEGWASSKIPVYHAIKDAVQYIRSRSLPASEPSPGTFVENSRRYLQPHAYRPSGVDPAGYGRAIVLDGNVYLRPSSINTWRIGVGVTVYEFRGDLYSVGVQGRERISQPMIAYRIRTIRLSGVSSLVMPVYTHVRNAAAQIFPRGINSMGVGASYILNLARYYKVPSLPSPSTVIGYAFIAAKVRTVGPYGLRSTAYIMQTHWVSMAKRSIHPAGFKSDTFYLGSDMEVYERFNRIRPYWNTQNWRPFGEASATLRNKTLRPYGYDYTEVSAGAFIELYIRTLPDVGLGNTNVFGWAIIKDRRLFVQLQGFGFSDGKISLDNTIRNLLPDPPWTRTVVHGGYLDPIEQVSP